MGVVDTIVQQQRERKRLEDEKARRQDAAFHVVMALPVEERQAVLVRLIDAEEAAGPAPVKQATPKQTPAPAPKPTPKFKGSGTYTDKAEAFILAHPEGVRTREVAGAIDQDVASCDGSIRNALKRGRIERRGRMWFPKDSPQHPPAPKKRTQTLRDLIYEVYAMEKGPLTAAAIFRGCQKLRPDVNRSSVDGEINRMRHVAKPALLVQVGTGENGGGVYNVTNGGAQATTH